MATHNARGMKDIFGLIRATPREDRVVVEAYDFETVIPAIKRELGIPPNVDHRSASQAMWLEDYMIYNEFKNPEVALPFFMNQGRKFKLCSKPVPERIRFNILYANKHFGWDALGRLNDVELKDWAIAERWKAEENAQEYFGDMCLEDAAEKLGAFIT